MKLYFVSPGRLITETGEEVEGIMNMVATLTPPQRSAWEGLFRGKPIQDPVAQVQITLLLEYVEDLPEVNVEDTVQELIHLERLLSDSDLRPNRDTWNQPVKPVKP